MTRRSLASALPLTERRYAVRAVAQDARGTLRVGSVEVGREGFIPFPPPFDPAEDADDLYLYDLYPEWPDEPADDDVVGLGRDEYVLLGGGAEPLTLVIRTR